MFDSLGKSLKGMLYEDSTGGAKPAPTQQAQAANAGAMSVTGQTYAPMPTVNQAMVDAIKKVTYGRNTAFTQLIAASETLSDVIPDPTMRLKAAFKTTGAGRTGRQIAEAVDVHLSDVAGEVRKFDAMIDGKITTEVGAIEQSAAGSQRQLESATSEIQQLSQRIAALQQSMPDLQQAVSQAQGQVLTKRNELEAAKHEFKMAADAVAAELNNSKSAIVSTLV
jgi:hypothetical protein